jgi:hypothetical protein
MKLSRIVIFLMLLGSASCEDANYRLGVQAINKIEDFRQKNHALPQYLGQIGIEETESGPIYYQTTTDSTYTIWYGLTLGESRTYDSKTKKWDR